MTKTTTHNKWSQMAWSPHMEERRRNVKGATRVDIGGVRAPHCGGIPMTNSHEIGIDFTRELVFDVDASDYQEERVTICQCDRHSVCSECWSRVMVPELTKLTSALSRIGFTQSHAWFSGSRGFHVWVSCSSLITRLVRMSIAEEIIENSGVRLDRAVTTQPNHTIRMPLSCHQHTQNIVSWLDFSRAPILRRLTYPEHIPEIERCASDILPLIFM